MDESSWSSILSQLDRETFDKFQSALYALTERTDVCEEKVASSSGQRESAKDQTEAIKELKSKLTKMETTNRGEFDRLEAANKELMERLSRIEEAMRRETASPPPSPKPPKSANRSHSHSKSLSIPSLPNGANGPPPKTPKLSHSKSINLSKSMSFSKKMDKAMHRQHGHHRSQSVLISSNTAKRKNRRQKSMLFSMPPSFEELKENESKTKPRMHFYQFGSRKLQMLKPTEYPSMEEAQRPVEGALELLYVHGYSGHFEDSRQNICRSDDGTKILYYMAKVAVVHDHESNTQRFFREHNDVITAICVCPSRRWAATGQKNPKEESSHLPYVHCIAAFERVCVFELALS